MKEGKCKKEYRLALVNLDEIIEKDKHILHRVIIDQDFSSKMNSVLKQDNFSITQMRLKRITSITNNIKKLLMEACIFQMLAQLLIASKQIMNRRSRVQSTWK